MMHMLLESLPLVCSLMLMCIYIHSCGSDVEWGKGMSGHYCQVSVGDVRFLVQPIRLQYIRRTWLVFNMP